MEKVKELDGTSVRTACVILCASEGARGDAGEDDGHHALPGVSVWSSRTCLDARLLIAVAASCYY